MKSIKNKLFPLALIVALSAGIISLSSWRVPQGKKGVADTVKKSSKKEAKSSKTTIITFDENGNPHEEIIENFSGDEDLKDLMSEDMHFNFDFPPIPDFNFDIAIPEIPDLQFDINPEDFKDFNFEEGNLDLLNDEIEGRLRDNLEAIEPEMQARLEEMSRKLSDMGLKFNDELQFDLNEKMKHLDEQMRNLDMNLNDQLLPLNFNMDKLKKLENLSLTNTERIKEFEQEVKKELIKDGYLKEGDKIDNMSFSDDEIEFNGKVIKKEHEKKYRALEEKYLSKSNFGRIE